MDRDFRDRCRQPMQAIISAAGNMKTIMELAEPHLAPATVEMLRSSASTIESQIKRLDKILSESGR